MTSTLSSALDDHALQQLLNEDVSFGDLTTESLGIEARPGTIRFFARDPMTVCCSEEAARLLTLCGADAYVRTPSGTPAETGTLLLEATGTAAALHRAWKTAQTLMEWSSGVTTSTAETWRARDARTRTPWWPERARTPPARAV
ncbi:beta/alpha barrel domain-containing protein [Thiocapsa bogorovii]|uniref:hypothetical protein n=1 Tax=Thiocapsa bogorovii TaxID=521689 RepID=UPI002FCBE90A